MSKKYDSDKKSNKKNIAQLTNKPVVCFCNVSLLPTINQ